MSKINRSHQIMGEVMPLILKRTNLFRKMFGNWGNITFTSIPLQISVTVHMSVA
jgi:hypothetical protein